MSQPNARRWCFTAWEIPTCVALPEDCRYIRWGEETCPTTGRTHWQGYVEFWKQRRVIWIRKWFLTQGVTNVFLVMSTGTAAENDKYTAKDGKNIVVHGEAGIQGKRSDLVGLANYIKSGEITGIRQGIESGYITGGLQAIKTAECLLKLFEVKRDWKPEVIVCHGTSGTGKSKWCRDNFPDAYWCGKTSKWWEGYDGHSDIIIDEFRDTWCDFDDLLRILDCYPYRVEIKGGSRQLLAKRIIFTSCFPPKKWYTTNSESRLQLDRRISRILDFDKVDSNFEVGGNIVVTQETPMTPDYTDLIDLVYEEEKCDF